MDSKGDAVSDYPTNEIADLPGVSHHGHDFSYAVWTPDSEIMLCNVPWTSDYRDIVRFSSKSQLNAFLEDSARSGPRHVMARMTYLRVGEPVRINVPFNRTYRYNYLRVRNGPQPVIGRTRTVEQDEQNVHVGYSETETQELYYFINEVRYVAPNTTELVIQLDVWQTFQQSVTFGNCYVERGHIGIANSSNFANNGRDFLTIPEGLDFGNEYLISDVYTHDVSRVHSGNAEPQVLVMSTTKLVEPYGDINDPVLNSASGSEFAGLPHGADIYLFDSVSAWKFFLASLYDKPWITQGIINVTVVPETVNMDAFTGTEVELGLTYANGQKAKFTRVYNGDPSALTVKNNTDVRTLKTNWRNDINIPSRYSRLKKFLTHPYTVVELTTYSGTPLVLKPENMWGNDIKVIEKFYPIPPHARLVYMPFKYNAANATVDGINGATFNDYGEMYDLQTGIFNFPSFSVVNNGYMSYMASNAHSIAYQHSSADWSQTKALAGADNSFMNTSRGISASYNMAGLDINAMNDTHRLNYDTMGYRAIQSYGNNIAGGIAGNNPAGMVTGAMNTTADLAINANQMSQQNSINNVQARGKQGIARNSASSINDSNYAYAQYAARGDYANAIGAINAKVQDAKMIQPTTSGQMGGDAFMIANHAWQVVAKVKTLQPAAMAAIGEYWLRYGYAVNRFIQMPSNFQAMEKFTYWKLRETYIYSSQCPELFRQTIRGIFEKGVTVWADANDIGAIDIANNPPRAGITL